MHHLESKGGLYVNVKLTKDQKRKARDERSKMKSERKYLVAILGFHTYQGWHIGIDRYDISADMANIGTSADICTQVGGGHIKYKRGSGRGAVKPNEVRTSQRPGYLHGRISADTSVLMNQYRLSAYR